MTPGAAAAGRRRSGAALAWRVLGAAAFVLYPPLVWYGFSLGRPRLAASILLCLALPLAVARLRGERARAARSLAVLPLVTVVALVLTAALDRQGFALAAPAAINAVLLATFGSTLRPGAVPMIERFARLQVADPSPEQRAWCRAWTRIWCAFFALNGAVAAALALWAPLAWWALYNGLLSYLLSGALLGGEWLLRRRRFGRT